MGPEASIAGTYELASVNGDTTRVFYNSSDGSTKYAAGSLTLAADGSYKYFVLNQNCFINGCENPLVKSYEGKWVRTSGNYELTDNADHSVITWGYSNNRLSGRDPRYFGGAADLVFRRCGPTEVVACAFS